MDFVQGDLPKHLVRAFGKALGMKVLPSRSPVGGDLQAKLRMAQRGALTNLEDA
jgi:hypothetical protein